MRNKSTLIKAIGLLATTISMAATLLSNWVSKKETEAAIEDYINKAFTNRQK